MFDDVVETGTGAGTTFEFTGDDSPSTPTIDALVPDAYKEKPWVKNLSGKPVDEIFKKVDNLESLIGQRTQINFPAEDAPQETVQQFRKHLNIPDTPDKYAYQPPEGDDNTREVWAEMAKVRDLSHWQKVAHKLHLTPSQYQSLVAEQEQRVVEQYLYQAQAEQKETQERSEAQAQEFNRLADQAFGADKDRALDTAKKVLSATVPNHVKPFIPQLDNTSLIVLAAYIHATHQQDSLNLSGANGGTAPATENSIRETGRQLQSELKALLDKGVQGPKIRDLEQRIKENYTRLSEHRPGN